MGDARATGAGATVTGFRVQLLGGFSVRRADVSIDLPPDAQRLVAFLSLQPCSRTRGYVAGSLWADGTEARALGNLRSTLWRVRRVEPELLNSDAHSVALSPTVVCDVVEIGSVGQDLLLGDAQSVDAIDHRPFTKELLPGWYDEWVVAERERIRQLALYSLESIAEHLMGRHREGAAIQATLAAIAVDPLRESPWRLLLRIHAAEGNVSEAIRNYDDYAALLHQELGLRPSPAMQELLADARSLAVAVPSHHDALRR